jgi:hypothetical protein
MGYKKITWEKGHYIPDRNKETEENEFSRIRLASHTAA